MTAAQGRGLTIDCGEGKHDVCGGFGTSSYLIPQTAGERFECACPCHEQPAAPPSSPVLWAGRSDAAKKKPKPPPGRNQAARRATYRAYYRRNRKRILAAKTARKAAGG